MKQLLAAAAAMLMSATCSFANTYIIDRAFNGATITGTITTNGDLGFITQASLVSWDIRVTSPTPLWGGVGLTDRFVSGTPNSEAVLASVNAFEDYMIVDLTTGGTVAFVGTSGNFWCISAGNGICGAPNPVEFLFAGEATGTATALVEHRGRVFFGRAAPNPCRQVNCGIPGR